MDDRNAQVGWTDAQWNRVRDEVLRAWQSVRVGGSFLPVYGALPPSTQIVPSEMFNPDGTVDERSTAPLLEIALPVKLSRQEVLEEDLSSALQQFRRRATQVAQLEDWYIFNGSYPYEFSGEYHPSYAFLPEQTDGAPFIEGAPEPIASLEVQRRGLLLRNPGALGLFEGAKQAGAGESAHEWKVTAEELNYRTLMRVTVDAMNTLEEHGYVAPYAYVFGRRPFQAAHEPLKNSVTFPRDRIEPLIGREILHASAIDIPPEKHSDLAARWRSRGVLLSLAGDAVDLAVAAEATPEFRHVDAQGNFVFSVYERFALRIKDPKAIVPITFTAQSPAGSGSDRSPSPGRRRPDSGLRKQMARAVRATLHRVLR